MREMNRSSASFPLHELGFSTTTHPADRKSDFRPKFGLTDHSAGLMNMHRVDVDPLDAIELMRSSNNPRRPDSAGTRTGAVVVQNQEIAVPRAQDETKRSFG